MKNLIACSALVLTLVAAMASPLKAEDSEVSFVFALYFAPKPSSDPEKLLEEQLSGPYRNLGEIATIDYTWLALDRYPPPDESSFRYICIGLSPELAAPLGAAEKVFLVSFKTSLEKLIETNRLANALLADLAENTSGYPWDEECRLLYSPNAWREQRIDTWEGGLPDMSKQITMHAYRDPELVRIITLGMRKFGLPDLVMEEVYSGTSRSGGNTINILAQAFVEGQSPDNNRLLLELSSLKHSGAKKSALENPLEGAEGRVLVSFLRVPLDEGDPENLLLRIDFPGMDGETATERQSQAFTKLFGASDEISGVDSSDQEVQAASRRARTALLALKDHFRGGLDPNERIVVKYGFPVSDSREYMWVEILQWNDAILTGVLLNDSHFDDELKAGKRVTVPVEEVFDYIHYKPDGSSVGNETGEIIKRKYQEEE
ncbi:MAG: DUF2314 domain-containing protein [Verrucomicrobiota bacterium]